MAPLSSSTDHSCADGSTRTLAKEGASMLSPIKSRMELELPPRHPIGFKSSAETPNFELLSNPLDEERSGAGPASRLVKTKALPKVDTASAQLAKRRSINEGTKRPTSPQ